MGNGLAVPRPSEVPPPPVFPHSEDDTPGAHLTHPGTSGTGLSTRCDLKGLGLTSMLCACKDRLHD